ETGVEGKREVADEEQSGEGENAADGHDRDDDGEQRPEAAGGLTHSHRQRKKRTTEGMSFRRSPSDLQTTRQSAYWIAAAGDGGGGLSCRALRGPGLSHVLA